MVFEEEKIGFQVDTSETSLKIVYMREIEMKGR